MGTSCSPSARLVAVTMISSSIKPCDSAGAVKAIASVAAAVYKLRVRFCMIFPLLLLVGAELLFIFYNNDLPWLENRARYYHLKTFSLASKTDSLFILLSRFDSIAITTNMANRPAKSLRDRCSADFV
jgi:hypothetical protein